MGQIIEVSCLDGDARPRQGRNGARPTNHFWVLAQRWKWPHSRSTSL